MVRIPKKMNMQQSSTQTTLSKKKHYNHIRRSHFYSLEIHRNWGSIIIISFLWHGFCRRFDDQLDLFSYIYYTKVRCQTSRNTTSIQVLRNHPTLMKEQCKSTIMLDLQIF